MADTGKTKVKTLYVILTGEVNGQDWHEIDRIETSGKAAAENAAYAKHGGGDRMRLVAVPARGFTPLYMGTRAKPSVVREVIGRSPAQTPTPAA